jgi:outer membrane lipoprotein-sorting protein
VVASGSDVVYAPVMMMKALAALVGAILASQNAEDVSALLQRAAAATRQQKGYEVAFKSRLQAVGDPLDREGKAVWTSPGLLYIHSTGSGREDQKIVRAGEQVWVYVSVQRDWYAPEEAGLDGAGSGIQNPDELLQILSKNAGSAKLVKSGTIQLDLTGNDLARVVKAGGFLWNQSSARVDLELDGSNRIAKVTCEATLVDAKNQTVRYSAAVTLSFDRGTTDLAFVDEKGRPIELSAEMKKKIEAVKGK